MLMPRATGRTIGRIIGMIEPLSVMQKGSRLPAA
jgi:hypothetical protein